MRSNHVTTACSPPTPLTIFSWTIILINSINRICVARVFGIFALLAIFVTSLGILGLVAFMVTQRTKEIGIRKVLGADIRSILYILMIEIIKLITIAFVVLVPVIYWGIGQWLQTFASRMDYQFDLFILPLGVTLIITLVTIGTHVLRAALSNPVAALRYE
ncbi:MAG: FtsX-like permease family protein [Calditrichales bacterium]|nr:MAG: FtsX-like permease family protein [Calditrichales bacterium]